MLKNYMSEGQKTLPSKTNEQHCSQNPAEWISPYDKSDIFETKGTSFTVSASLFILAYASCDVVAVVEFDKTTAGF